MLVFSAVAPLLGLQPWPWPLALLLGPGPQFVFTGLGPVFVFTGPGLQFVCTGPGPQFVFIGPGSKLVFNGPGLHFITSLVSSIFRGLDIFRGLSVKKVELKLEALTGGVLQSVFNNFAKFTVKHLC